MNSSKSRVRKSRLFSNLKSYFTTNNRVHPSENNLPSSSGVPLSSNESSDPVCEEQQELYELNQAEDKLSESSDSDEQFSTDSSSLISLLPTSHSSIDTLGLDEAENNFEYESDSEKMANALKRLVEKHKTIPHSFIDDLLHELKLFPNFNALPRRAVTLLKTKTLTEINFVKDSSGEEAQYFYVGVLNGLKNQIENSELLLKTLEGCDEIRVSFSTDGAAFFKLAVKTKTAWPILGKIHLDDLLVEPFVVAVYFGQTKPSHEFFFEDFCHELSRISGNECQVHTSIFKFRVFFFTADAPARMLLKGTKSFNSKKGCERCTTGAVCIEHRMSYPFTPNAPLRTHDSFLQRLDPDHHRSNSLFESVPGVNMVSSFVIEPMHGIDEGVTKRVMFHLFVEKKGKSRLAPSVSEAVSLRILKFTPYIPRDFQRVLIPLRHLNCWKATMYRLLNTYLMPVVFIDLISERLYGHLMKLYVSLRIARNRLLVHNQLALLEARSLLTKFVEEHENIFGPGQCVFNVHNLLHTLDDVEHLKVPLDDFSSYSTEDKLRDLMSRIKSGNRIGAQLARRLSETKTVNVKRLFFGEPEFVTKKKSVTPQSVKYLRFDISFNSTADSFVMLKSCEVVKVVSISGRTKDAVVTSQKMIKTGDVFTSPKKSSAMGISWVELSDEYVTHSLDDVKAKLMVVPVRSRFACIPLLHTIC